MRNLIIVLFLFLVSCEKKWKCEITTSGYGTTSTYIHTFEGTRKEMKEFEQTAFTGNGITQTIDCK